MKKNDQIDAMFSVFGLSGEYRTPARIACLQRIVNKFEFETEMYVYACQLSLDKPSSSGSLEIYRDSYGSRSSNGCQETDGAEKEV